MVCLQMGTIGFGVVISKRDYSIPPIPSALERTHPFFFFFVLIDKEVNKSSALRSTTFELPSNDTRRAVARWFSFWSTRVWPVCYLTGIPGPRRLELLLVAS